MSNELENEKNLRDLCINWLSKSPFVIKEDLILDGKSGEEYKLDLLVEMKNSNEKEYSPSKLAIYIADIKKSAGTDVISKIERSGKDLRMKTLLVSNKFSVQAKHLAQRANVMIMDRSELEQTF